MKAYAGIGSRSTPLEIRDQMTMAATQLAQLGLILRSGGAQGADMAFAKGAPENQKQIFLPWRGFNGDPSPLTEIPQESFDIARSFHPNWDALRPSVKRLMARNSQQVLGKELNDPVIFVLCWTPGGRGTGGTGQALRIARHFNIPIFDMGAMDLMAIQDGIETILAKEEIAA